MSSLDDLKKGIYRPEIDGGLTKRLDYKIDQKREELPPKEPFLNQKRKKWLKIISSSFVVVLLIGIALSWLGDRTSFSQDNVFIQIDGPQKIQSGAFLKYDFSIKNANGAAIENCQLSIEYPKGSQLQNPQRPDNQDALEIGRLAGGKKKMVSSYVKIFGPEEYKGVVRVSLKYTPPRISSELKKETDFAVDIVSSPLKIVIDEPKIVTLNKDIVYTINFSNKSEDTYKGIRFKINYPDGFNPKSFVPINPDIANNTWVIDQISPSEEKEFKVTGVLTKELDIINLTAVIEMKDINDQYQVYSQAFSAISLTPAPVNISIQTTNLSSLNIANPGSDIEFIVNFNNTTDSVLRNLALSVVLGSNLFDSNSVIPENQGIYIEKEKKIVWDSRRISQLAILGPFEAGSTKFRLKLKNSIPIESYNDKNFTMEAKASILPNMVPPELSGIQLENSSQTSIKLNSVLIAKGAILDQNTQQPFTSSGPYPPKSGEKTTYLVDWQLLNYYNNIENITVSSQLPIGVYWENTWWPQDNNITFDPLTGQLLWQIKELKAGTGLTSPVKRVIFKVGSIPSPTQIGSRLRLVEEAQVSGKDMFTQQGLSAKIYQLEAGLSVER
jgi:hypothetical protein